MAASLVSAGEGRPLPLTSVPSSPPLSCTKRRNGHRTNSNVIDRFGSLITNTTGLSLFMVPQVATGKIMSASRGGTEVLALGPALRRSTRSTPAVLEGVDAQPRVILNRDPHLPLRRDVISAARHRSNVHHPMSHTLCLEVSTQDGLIWEQPPE